jgi:hypothetical protein
MSTVDTPKYNKKQCVNEFIEHLIQGNGPDNFRRFSLNGELDKYHVRGMAWKIFMEVLPETEPLDQWVESLDHLRKEYKKKAKNILKPQKFSGDPLGGMAAQNSNESWDTYYQDKDVKKLINLDLDRTFQELSLFHDSNVKKNLANILFIWNKENMDVGYQQGMNDLLAVTFLALYPCYFKNNSKKKKDELLAIASDQLSAINNAEYLYDFFHDEDELQSDLYYCFSKLMKRGIKELFETNITSQEKKEMSFKKYELFSNQWVHDPSDDIQNPLNIRCTMIIKEKLKAIDLELFQHFQRIGLNCGIFLQRWLKCMFDREFDLKDIFTIWDAIFATPDSKTGYGLIFIDYISISMILRIRKQLLQSEQNECFTTLFKYPHIDKISDLVIFSNKLQQAVEDKVSGRRSLFLEDITGIPSINNTNNNNTSNKNNVNNMMNFGMQDYNNFSVNNNNNSNTSNNDNKNFFRNAMGSMGGLFSSIKDRFSFKGNILGDNKGENNNMSVINMPIQGVAPLQSIADSAQRLNDLYNKYHSIMSQNDDKELLSIIQYLNNYKS